MLVLMFITANTFLFLFVYVCLFFGGLDVL